MKSFATLLVLAALLVSLPVSAQTRLAATNVQQGYVDASNNTSTGTTFGTGYQGDGNTTTAGDYGGPGYPPMVAGDDAQISSLFQNPYTVGSLTLSMYINNDGGWFGVSGSDQDGTTTTQSGTLSAAALVAPTLQYSTVDISNYSSDTAGVWITVPVADYTTNYMTLMTGASVGTVVTSTFTLDTPITGAADFRLIGTAGGTGNAGTGYINVTELDQFSPAPEPSTYALLFGGLGLLVLAVRLRKLTA